MEYFDPVTTSGQVTDRAWVGTLAEEQAALRRVATLVAGGASSREVFDAVAEEVAQVLYLANVAVCRYDDDGAVMTVLAVYGERPAHPVIALSPQGRQLTQPLVEELALLEHVTLLSARFEGFDERIVEHLATDAVSIGPYVLSNGDLPAMVLVDAIARRLPGALAEGSGELESFSDELGGGLEYPHYTRPAEYRGWRVPDVLLSGDHARIEGWRREQVR